MNLASGRASVGEEVSPTGELKLVLVDLFRQSWDVFARPERGAGRSGSPLSTERLAGASE